MGRRYRIFISHSANKTEEPVTATFLEQLVAKLDSSNEMEVLVDQRNLQAGDEWCQRLYSWMGLCDAAVILLSPRAITRESSVWVPREVNLLLWRKALDPDFVIIPVLVSGLERADIAENPFVSDTSLNDIQFADGISDSEKIDLIHRELLARAEAPAHKTVFDPVQVFVEDTIRRFAPQVTVEETLTKHYADDSWKPYVQIQSLLAVKMVRHAIVPEIDAVISDVARGSQPEYHLAARLYQAVFPMRLPAEASCTLLSLCQQQVGYGAVVVNCHDTWIVRMMLRTATGQLEDDLLRAWRILEIPDGWGDDDESEITTYLASELAEAILGTGGWDLLSQEIKPLSSLNRHLQEFSRESGAPILVCASYSLRWAELAPKLATKFPTIVFLLWSGGTIPDIVETDASGIVPLNPALPAGSDRDWNFSFRRRMQLLGARHEIQ
ncbi:MAG: toll/interleukin-1 receptor domain-containing protein [Candidatus Thiodiazotropha sp.]